MQNRNWRTRDVLTLSAVFLILPAITSSQRADRAQFSAAGLRAAAADIIDAEPQTGPQPPCGTDPIPPYPRLDEPANVKAGSPSALGSDWKPPECTGWTATGFTSLVTTAARFRYTSGAEGLLRHIGAISELAGMRYWSTTHQRWQTLIKEAHALTDVQNGQRRGDFTPDEMQQGNVLYFEQVDNLSGKAIYQLRILESSRDRIVAEIENVTTMHYLFMPVFHPDEMQSIYFFDRESDSVWRFYSIVRTGKNANHLIAGNEKSSINRAVAFYRRMVGIPTDQEPPAAR